MSSDRRKVFFVPLYFYLSAPGFERVITDLGDRAECTLIRISSHAEPVDAAYTEAHYASRGTRFVDMNIAAPDGPGADRREQYAAIYSFVARHRPDLVVVTSDLGGIHVNYFLEACRLIGIEVAIFCAVDVLTEEQRTPGRRIADRILSSVPRSRFVSRWRAELFRNALLGTFARSAPIFVLSESGKERLVEKGISESRVKRVKLPASATLNLSGDPRRRFGIPPTKPLVVLFTECIDSIYGEPYMEATYEAVAELCARFPQIAFVVKLHPKESELAANFYRACFEPRGIPIVRSELAAEAWIGESSLCIAHYSTVLMTAALMQRPFLSLNLENDSARTFIPPDLRKAFEVSAIEQLEPYLRELADAGEHIRLDALKKSVAALAASLDDAGQTITDSLLAMLSRQRLG